MRATLARKQLIWLTAALMLVTLPHALEDFHYGDFARLGIAPSTSRAILVLAYLAQLTGIALLAAGRRAGGIVAGLMGIVWLAGDVALHGHDFVFAGAEYRHGFISRLLEALVFLLGAACAATGWRAWRLGGTR